ncbi:MAG: acetyl-CoA decarbonylase/synthase complex subunit gamma [bacterium]
MGLTGIQIYKLLPQTNCKECGDPTCLAFAMKLAAGKADISLCPYVSEEAKAKLSEATAPPIREFTIGAGDGAVKVGGETVMFRHEKTFFNPTPIAVMVKDTEADSELDSKLAKIKGICFERVGKKLCVDMIAVKNESGDKAKFLAVLDKVAAVGKPMLIASDNLETLKEAAEKFKAVRPLLYAATSANVDAVAEIAKTANVPVVAKGANMDDLTDVTAKLAAAGVKDIAIDTGARTVKDALKDNVFARRASIKQKVKEVGYPTIVLANEITTDPMLEAVIASALISQYAGIVVLSEADPAKILPITVSRMNVFTDPQRPMVVEQGIYPINNPDENSPVIITVNFALTYFIVSAEIEASRVPCWLMIMDTEGLSVLTAWSAGKFVADAMAAYVKKTDITQKVKHKKIIIPGYVAQLSGEFQEELGEGWEVQIGPREAGDLPKYLKMWK